jgi:hypothetical protein
MLATIGEIQEIMTYMQRQLYKVRDRERGWKAAAARVRKESLQLEKFLKEFRKVSVQEAKE